MGNIGRYFPLCKKYKSVKGQWHKMKKWNSLLEMLNELNNKNNYLILRNFELYTSDILLEEHDDIDILCDDRGKIFQAMGAEKISASDEIHVVVNIAGRRVRVDVRCVGDSYYDETWERDMLSTRIMYEGKFYIMNDENYYYSILYHEFFHKRELREDYIERLKLLSQRLGFRYDRRNLKQTLENYLKMKEYQITDYVSK